MKNWFLKHKSYFIALLGLRKKNKPYKHRIEQDSLLAVESYQWGSGMGQSETGFTSENFISYWGNSFKLDCKKLVELGEFKNWVGDYVYRKYIGAEVSMNTSGIGGFSCSIYPKGEVWNALWLIGQDSDGYKEVDIFETFCDAEDGIRKMTATYHTGDDSETNRKQKVSHYYIMSGFVDYKVKIGKKIKIYVNGYLVNEQPNTFIQPPLLVFTTKKRNGSECYPNNGMYIVNLKLKK